MATGDLRASLRKLEACLRNLKYPGDVNYQGLALGDPSCYLPIVSHALLSYSPHLAKHIMGFSVELSGANDLRFLESVYKVLRDLFNYKPQLTKEQFLQFRFADRKTRLVCDIINFAIQKHKELSKSSSLPPRRTRFRPFPPELEIRDFSPSEVHECIPAAPVQPSRPLVERHTASVTPVLYSLSSDDQVPLEEEGTSEKEEEEEEVLKQEEGRTEEIIEPTAAVPAAVTARLQAIESRLQCCEQRLAKLEELQGRPQSPQSPQWPMAGQSSRWENLESRVVLLETKLALGEAQKRSPVITDVEKISSPDDLPQAKFTSSAEEDVRTGSDWTSRSPASHSPPLHDQENVKNRLERIANLMKDTSRLLQSV